MSSTPAPPAEARSDERARALRRMQAYAVALLLLMVAGLVTSHLQGYAGAWAWIAAFCEAAAIGALADWFAVVALFRHPLGLPIPHTAIIPRSKARIADNLAVFVRDHFLSRDALLARLQVFDPAARLAQWLGDARRMRAWAVLGRGWALQMLELFDDERLQSALRRTLIEALTRWDAARSAGDVLTFLTRGGRHQALLDIALERLGGYLGQESVRARVAAVMLRIAREEHPRVVKAVDLVTSVEDIADALARRVARALVDELKAVLENPEHPARIEYEAQVLRFIDRLREDPELVAHVGQLKQRLIDSPAVQDYARQLAGDVRDWLHRDLARRDSRLARYWQDGAVAFGRRLGQDARLRAAINEHVLAAAARMAEDLRAGVTEHIANTVKGWDDRQLVRELELSIGKDLQYIRFNGTLVGGLVGLALHALLSALPA
ncbi:DUF445 family protein [Verticiella sediminum]|uniref:DUF445 family protein n=1 Tax=Verticiella sediminum TaxID=1247510 RepID=A0A556A7X5_9BURK|nr:DUF445 family protein [Verticiella sediminum]TSH88987.1 DUF445 family protein [Verticiella sediminum]